jgi:2-oxoisovalerate dehydrogenase E1 component
VVVRVAGGFGRCGDPWHSVTNETGLLRTLGWQVFVPANAADAAGLLRAALRGEEPTFFLEHRALLDADSARRPYPGDDHVCAPGRARVVQPGDALTVVTWGAMVERCEQARAALGAGLEILDLRTLAPWDRDTVVESVRRTHRCLIVHEETLTAGFGAEIAATVGRDCFLSLEAPVDRLAVPDIPLAYDAALMAAALPDAAAIAERAAALLAF